MKPLFERAALIGTGLIGGSLFLALRAAGAVAQSVGHDRRHESAEAAHRLGIVGGVAATAAACVSGADLVVVATPVGALPEVFAAIGPALAPDALIIDVGSTKRDVLEAAARLPHAERFVGCHPIAGTERSGPESATATLFRGRRVLLTPLEGTSPHHLERAETLWRASGALPERIAPALHDRALAAVSHLPHVAAFALAGAIDDLLDADAILAAVTSGLYGGGFADTTRIAASDPTMWRDVFLANRDTILADTARLADRLEALRRAVADGDAAAIERLITSARAGRRRVMGDAR